MKGKERSYNNYINLEFKLEQEQEKTNKNKTIQKLDF